MGKRSGHRNGLDTLARGLHKFVTEPNTMLRPENLGGLVAQMHRMRIKTKYPAGKADELLAQNGRTRS